MHVFQTAGVPPSIGSTIFENIGCTANSSAAFTNSVIENSTTTEEERVMTRLTTG
jgi:UDP-N-acetylenolpyruvoylglucosamine reductase